jgi:uncharacterized protein (TIGR04255 family)
MIEVPQTELAAESEEHFQLDDAPIIEAVVDIDCDMPPAFDVAATEPEAKKRFSDAYPNLKKSFIQQHEIQARPNEPPKLTATQALRALQFFSNDSLQLVQVRSNGYSFNRLRPYSTLDDYLPEIQRTWRLFVELVAPVLVQRITLRYINRILLPMEEGRVPLDRYLTLGPRLPQEHDLTYMGFLNQYSAVEPDSGNTITITLTSQKIEQGGLPVIFDIEARREFGSQPDNWDELKEVILSLRRLKNRVFKRTLSKECLNLFQR